MMCTAYQHTVSVVYMHRTCQMFVAPGLDPVGLAADAVEGAGPHNGKRGGESEERERRE